MSDIRIVENGIEKIEKAGIKKVKLDQKINARDLNQRLTEIQNGFDKGE